MYRSWSCTNLVMYQNWPTYWSCTESVLVYRSSKNYVPKWYVPKVSCTDMDLPPWYHVIRMWRWNLIPYYRRPIRPISTIMVQQHHNVVGRVHNTSLTAIIIYNNVNSIDLGYMNGENRWLMERNNKSEQEHKQEQYRQTTSLDWNKSSVNPCLHYWGIAGIQT